MQIADATGSRLALVSDRHQLTAVGRGGVLDLVCRSAADCRVDVDGVRQGPSVMPEPATRTPCLSGHEEGNAVLPEAGLAEVAGVSERFAVSPMPGVEIAAQIRRARPVEEAEEMHEQSIGAWSEPRTDGTCSAE